MKSGAPPSKREPDEHGLTVAKHKKQHLRTPHKICPDPLAEGKSSESEEVLVAALRTLGMQ